MKKNNKVYNCTVYKAETIVNSYSALLNPEDFLDCKTEEEVNYAIRDYLTDNIAPIEEKSFQTTGPSDEIPKEFYDKWKVLREKKLEKTVKFDYSVLEYFDEEDYDYFYTKLEEEGYPKVEDLEWEDLDKLIKERYKDYKYIGKEVYEYDLSESCEYIHLYFTYKGKLYGVDIIRDYYDSPAITSEVYPVEPYKETITKYKRVK